MLSKGEGVRDIGQSMSIGNLIWSGNSVTISYLIHYDSLFENATYYYKLGQLFYYKNSTEVYFKMRQVFC